MIADIHHDVAQALRHFQIDGELVEARPYGSGHINDTYLGVFETLSGRRRFIHQRVNKRVFTNPERLIENIARVTCHLRSKITAAGGDADRECLTLVRADDDRWFHLTETGDYWRTYLFIEDAATYDLVETPGHLYSAGRAFGTFQKMLADLPGEPLHETIPLFHHTANRVRLLREAIDADVLNRASGVRREIEFALSRADEMAVLVRLDENRSLPRRITHNDTKFNNVMIDNSSGEAVCVIDLDTVMPGLALYDFGDMVRTGTTTAVEDETNLEKVGIDLTMFEALVKGYMQGAGDMLVPQEVDNLALSGRVITYTIGVRFLTDYLRGDKYFKIHRSNHNLDRCRTQFKLVSDIESHFDQLRQIVAQYR